MYHWEIQLSTDLTQQDFRGSLLRNRWQFIKEMFGNIRINNFYKVLQLADKRKPLEDNPIHVCLERLFRVTCGKLQHLISRDNEWHWGLQTSAEIKAFAVCKGTFGQIQPMFSTLCQEVCKFSKILCTQGTQLLLGSVRSRMATVWNRCRVGQLVVHVLDEFSMKECKQNAIQWLKAAKQSDICGKGWTFEMRRF